MRIRKIASSVFLGLLVVTVASCGSDDPQVPENHNTAALRQVASTRESKSPVFQLPDVSGKLFDSRSLEGKVQVINFWATWCIYCKIEIPDLNKLYQKYQSAGMALVGISLDQGGAAVVQRFMQEHPIDYTVLIGTNEVARSFGGIVGLPTTFVLDRQGNIVKAFPGFVKVDLIESVVQSLL